MHRRTAPALLAAAATIAFPAVAEAHHVAGGTAGCELDGNVPTIVAHAQFVGFSSSNKPVHGVLNVDALAITVEPFTFPGSSYPWTGTVRTTAGSHHVTGSFDWPGRGNENGSFQTDVTCPTPVPPPVVPPAPPAPPTPPRTVPAPPPAVPHYKTVVRRITVKTRIQNTDPYVQPPALASAAASSAYSLRLRWTPSKPHGTTHRPTWVNVRMVGPHRWQHYRWYIDGRRFTGTEYSHVRGRSVSLALFDLGAWAPGLGSGQAAWDRLYGWHTVKVTATRKVRVRVS